MNIYSGDIHSITSPPAKLHYVLVVHAKSRGRSADQSHMTGHSTTEKEKVTQWMVGPNKTFSYYSFFFCSTYYYTFQRIITEL